MTQKKAPDWRNSFREASPYMGLGLQLAFTMVFFTIGGYLLDRWLDTLPWLTVAGGVVGMAATFIQLVRVSSQMSSEQRARRRKQGAGSEEQGLGSREQ